jgi:hypothetical protein
VRNNNTEQAEILYNSADLNNWGVIQIGDGELCSEHCVILKAGITAIPLYSANPAIAVSALFRRVEGTTYRSIRSIITYIFHNIFPEKRIENTTTEYALSKYTITAQNVSQLHWIRYLTDFESVQENALITKNQVVLLNPEWGEQDNNLNCRTRHHNLPDGSYLYIYNHGGNPPADISDRINAEIKRRCQKSARS